MSTPLPVIERVLLPRESTCWEKDAISSMRNRHIAVNCLALTLYQRQGREGGHLLQLSKATSADGSYMEIYARLNRFIEDQKLPCAVTSPAMSSSKSATKQESLSTGRRHSVQLFRPGKKERYMKASKLLSAGLVVALFFATSAFAQGENKGKLSLPESVTVEGKQLPPGNYKVQWEGTGPNVEVKILKGKETVATVPARLVAGQTKTLVDSYGERSNRTAPECCPRSTSGGRISTWRSCKNRRKQLRQPLRQPGSWSGRATQINGLTARASHGALAVL